MPTPVPPVYPQITPYPTPQISPYAYPQAQPMQPAAYPQPMQPAAYPQPMQPAAYPQAQPMQPAPFPQAQPMQPAPYPQPQPQAQKPPKPPSTRSFETILGKNILGIVASVLVFLGLIFLGVLVIPLITNPIKVVLMFTLSAALTVAGFLLNKRFSNYFTKALLGTGCGAFFIAIQMTHLYFNMLNDIVAFALLLVWLAATLLIMRQTQSLLIGIIAHAGMLFSVCFGYTVGIQDNKILLLLGYQIAATLLIVIGNVLWCKKMYRFGLLASLAITVYASSIMVANGLIVTQEIPVALIITVFTIQFLGASFIAYFLFQSIIRAQNSGVQVLLQLLNLALWITSLILTVIAAVGALYTYFDLQILLGQYGDHYLIDVMSILILIILITVTLLIIVLRQKLNYSKTLQFVTTLTLIGTMTLVLFINYILHTDTNFYPHLILFTIPAIICIIARRLYNSRIYGYTALALLWSDSLHMLSPGYSSFNNLLNLNMPIKAGALTSALPPICGFIYLALIMGLLFLAYRQFGQAKYGQTKTPGFKLMFKITSIIYFQLAVIAILFALELDLSVPLAFIICIASLLILNIAKQDTPKLLFRINELFLFLILALHLFINPMPHISLSIAILDLIAVALALILLINRIRLAAQANAQAIRTPFMRLPNTDLEVLSALAIHGLIISAIAGTTTWLSQHYVLSLASMIIALALIALGFWSRVRSLRLYGLIIVIICVLKLVTFDVGDINTIMRVVAFIGGGLICFGISALYNFAVKRFNNDKPKPPNYPPPQF